MSTRVILVDNHRILREGIRSLLEKEPDIDVVGEAENAETAVQLARELSPDVVVMDIGLPDLSGIIATSQIIDGVPNVKVLALSMHSKTQFVKKMIEVGASGYLLKECAAEELTRAIKAVVAGQMYLSPEIAGGLVDNLLDKPPAPGIKGFSTLTGREREVIKLLVEGRTTKDAAAILEVSTKTIETHRRHAYTKLGIDNMADLTKLAIRAGLTTLEPSSQN
ncbi:MAG: response regulator transcription factor [Anaerolineales bacterium]|nr:response regulator transcription factor [Anaerolineales bacterium]